MNAIVTSLPRFVYLSRCLVATAFMATQSILPVRADPVGDGKVAFAICSACHTVTGTNDSGPYLNGVMGRKAGSVSGFDYSAALKKANIVWDAQTLDKYLANPQHAVPGNRMPFPGLPDPRKRADIIAYLATIK